MRAVSFPNLLLIFALVLCFRAAFAQGTASKSDSLKQRLGKVKSDTDKVAVLIELLPILKCDDGQQRLRYAKEALKISEKQKFTKGIMAAKHGMGKFYKECVKNYPAAIDWFEQSLELAMAEGNKQSQFLDYSNIAECYTNMAEYGKALNCYQQILDLNLGRDTVIQILGNTGVLYQDMGNYANALDNYHRAYNLMHEDLLSSDNPTHEDSLTITALKCQIATVYISIPDYDRALESYREILELNQQIQFNWFDVLARMGIGDCYLNKKEFRPAIASYKLALGILENFNESTKDEYLAGVYCKLGETYNEMGKVDSALFHATKSLQIAEGQGGKPKLQSQLPKTYIALAKIHSRNNSFVSAKNYLDKAIAITKQTGANEIQSEAWQELSHIYEKMGQPAEALAAYHTYITLRDSIYSSKKMQELTRIDMQGYFDRQKFKDSMIRVEEKAEAGYQLQRQRILTYSGFGGLALLLLLSFFIFRNYKQEKKANVMISEASKTISKEKQVSEQLLLNILPEEVADELKANGKVVAKLFEPVTVFFTDFVDFTIAGERLSPQQLVEELHTCFKAFDEIIDKYDIEKIKTVGDAYLAVSGLPLPNPSHGTDVINAAIEICRFMENRKKELGERTFNIRIGVSTGSVVAGIVGVKKFAYDIWGDTVNIAARMEQTSEPGRINISEYTYELVKDNFNCTYRGEIAAKNKGKMRMYFIDT